MTDTNPMDGITAPLPLDADDAGTLIGALDRNRRTFAWKCADLDAAAMGTRIAASAMSLGGLVRHMTRVEADCFDWKLLGTERTGSAEAWDTDWDWTGDEDVAEVWQQWRAAVERSKDNVEKALADGGLDRAKGHAFEGWGTPSLRRILVDMIEEYARHTGHADLLREAIDGRVGEDAP